MVPDYLVSGTGLVLSLPPLVLFELPAFTTWLLGAMGLAFAVHGLGVIHRQRIRVETDEDGLWVSPPRRRIAWNEVTRFGLAYFSTRRDGARGWMELRIASPAATLRVDSRLERFDDLVGRAWSAASRRGLELDPATRANLDALARISRHLTAADADRPASTALNAARVLDVPSSTPARPDSRSPCRCRPLRALASRSGEKSGPGMTSGTPDGSDPASAPAPSRR